MIVAIVNCGTELYLFTKDLILRRGAFAFIMYLEWKIVIPIRAVRGIIEVKIVTPHTTQEASSTRLNIVPLK
jgi:hypothetical protein